MYYFALYCFCLFLCFIFRNVLYYVHLFLALILYRFVGLYIMKIFVALSSLFITKSSELCKLLVLGAMFLKFVSRDNPYPKIWKTISVYA